ncbi:PilN family type IVB pilus formation outer membrane protein (plasmid) [Plesiomonas shigelloides]|uniref:PilN family type IVB pilus formation outer membrane protein n=1 Tax=Plesiomonas shigelloides TaxID=703 RepID=UPI000D12101C|nr:PilN family type IVB pilus formation outer membrane protein [Plesiomonas shigelloides]AVQ89139.1 PilN family type IVB pilus formation outer membrane protein [Plesiomonas shigelloides]
MKKIILLAGFLNLLSGCAAKNIYDTMQQVGTEAAKANSLMRDKTAEPFKISNKIWVQTQPILEKKKKPNPLLNCSITLSKSALTLHEFAARASTLCGVTVRVTPDAISYTQGDMSSVMTQSVQSNNTAAPVLPDLPSLPIPANPGQNMRQEPMSLRGGVNAVDVNYSGTLSGLLDRYTASMGVYWRSNPDNTVDIYYLDTQVFTLEAMAATVNSSSNVESNNSTTNGASNSDGGISGNGGSSQSVQQQMKYDLLANIDTTLKQMVTQGVGRYSISPATGAVIVTDTPVALRQIGEYLERENKTISQQVRLKFEVYSVALNDADNLSLDMNLTYKRMNQWSGGLVSENKDFGGSQGTISWDGGRFDGSKLMLRALSEQGKVSLVQTGSVTTTNLQPVPVQLAHQVAYLASSQSTATPDVGTTSTLTPGSVTTGFNMMLLPNIVPNTKNVWVHFNLNLTELVGIHEVKSGDSIIQTPEITIRTLTQRAKLRSGETIMIAGLDQSEKSGTAKGAGAAWNPLFGGEWARSNKNTVLVCVLTPYLE